MRKRKIKQPKSGDRLSLWKKDKNLISDEQKKEKEKEKKYLEPKNKDNNRGLRPRPITESKKEEKNQR